MEDLLNTYLAEENIVLNSVQIKLFNALSKCPNVLLVAPTGSGKTFSIYLYIIDYLSKMTNLQDVIYCVYIVPLKALTVDIYNNLKSLCKKINKNIRISIRTGDRKTTPGHIIITTPESFTVSLLYLEYSNLKIVVLDEIHNLFQSKRGCDVALTIARLSALTKNNLIKIGVSATVSPISEVAKFLDETCEIVKVNIDKQYDISSNLSVYDRYNPKKTYEELIGRIIQYCYDKRTVVVFTNNRALTEQIVQSLREVDAYVNSQVVAHHGSMSKSIRKKVEADLKNGLVSIVVCSTSLQLGLDIGSIDAVFQVGSCRSTFRGMQRIGRAGHSLSRITKGLFFTNTPFELLESIVITKYINDDSGDILRHPINALDVLAQHIIAQSIMGPYNIKAFYDIVTKTYSYKSLKYEDYFSVIEFLSGQSAFSRTAKILLNDDTITSRSFATKLMYLSNCGTIVQYNKLKVKQGRYIIGSLDVGYLQQLKSNVVFNLGGKAYKFLDCKDETIYVEPTTKISGSIPQWFSEYLPLNPELGKKLQKEFLSLIHSKQRQQITNEYKIDNFSRSRLLSFLDKITLLYKDTDYVIEFSKNDNLSVLAVHCIRGRRINDCISRLLAYYIYDKYKVDVSTILSEVGFILKVNDLPLDIIFAEFLHVDTDLLIVPSILNSAAFFNVFKNVCLRGFAILKTLKNTRATLHYLYKKAIETTGFPYMLEATNEILNNRIDYEYAKQWLDCLRNNGYVCNKVQALSQYASYMYSTVSGAVDNIQNDANIKQYLQPISTEHLLKIKDNFYLLPNALFYNGHLIISDLHLAQELDLYENGCEVHIPVFNMLVTSITNYQKLTKASKLIILGDVKNKIFHLNSIETTYFEQFFKILCSLFSEIIITKGNHDVYLEKYIPTKVKVVQSYTIGNYTFAHGHKKHSNKFLILGHKHNIVTVDSNVVNKQYVGFSYYKLQDQEVLLMPAFAPLKMGVDSRKDYLKAIQSKHWFYCNNNWYLID